MIIIIILDPNMLGKLVLIMPVTVSNCHSDSNTNTNSQDSGVVSVSQQYLFVHTCNMYAQTNAIASMLSAIR